MSAFTGAGFAQGFVTGAGAVDQLISRRKEEALRKQQMETEERRYQDRLGLEREKMDLAEEASALDRGLKERQLESLDKYRQALAGQSGIAQKAAEAAAAREEEKWQYQKHLQDKAEANELLRSWRAAAEVNRAEGNPVPEMTPEVLEAAKKVIPSAVIQDPGGFRALSSRVVSGLREGSMHPGDPEVGKLMDVLSPVIGGRGVGSVLKNPVIEDGKEVVPAGAKVVRKAGAGLAEYEGGRFVPMIRVTAEKDGQMFEYTAPATLNGTADPDDPVLAMSPDELLKAVNTATAASHDELFLNAFKASEAASAAPMSAIDRAKLEKEQLGVQKERLSLEQLREKGKTKTKTGDKTIDLTKVNKDVKKYLEDTLTDTGGIKSLQYRFGQLFPGKAPPEDQEGALNNMMAVVRGELTNHVGLLADRYGLDEAKAKNIVLSQGVYDTRGGRRMYKVPVHDGRAIDDPKKTFDVYDLDPYTTPREGQTQQQGGGKAAVTPRKATPSTASNTSTKTESQRVAPPTEGGAPFADMPTVMEEGAIPTRR